MKSQCLFPSCFQLWSVRWKEIRTFSERAGLGPLTSEPWRVEGGTAALALQDPLASQSPPWGEPLSGSQGALQPLPGVCLPTSRVLALVA